MGNNSIQNLSKSVFKSDTVLFLYNRKNNYIIIIARTRIRERVRVRAEAAGGLRYNTRAQMRPKECRDLYKRRHVGRRGLGRKEL